MPMLSVAVPVFVSVTLWPELVVPICWLEKVKFVADKLTAGSVPVPVRLTACGLPEAVSVIVSVPLRAPVAVGVKVTSIAQLLPAATDPLQLLVSAKSPVVAMLVMLKGAVPLFPSVTTCGALVVLTTWPLKVTLFGATLAVAAVPVPLRLITWGIVLASSVTVSVPPRVPVADGVKVTLIVQLPPVGTEPLQLFVCAKSPVVAMLLMLRVAEPGLLRVTGIIALVVPTC